MVKRKLKKMHTLNTYLILLLLIISSSTLAAKGQDDWQGTWDTNWRGGGATLYLQQQGTQVTGFYEPYEGRIEATLNGKMLKGRWFQSQSEGEFEFSMAKDQATFAGRFDNGEWWNGQRLSRTVDAPVFITISQTNPRDTLRGFLNAGNWLSYGDYNYLDDFLSCVILPQPLLQSLYSQRAAYVREFFHLISHATIRIFSIPKQLTQDTYEYPLFSHHADINFSLRFIRQDNKWLIQLPDKNSIDQLKTQLVTAGLYQDYNPQRHFDLATPRDTLRTFLEEFSNWHSGSRERVLSTINFSDIPDNVVEWEGPINAQYLKRVLDRSGYVVWQEVPNISSSRVPYVHFKHPNGEIVIEPVTKEGKTIWQFSPKTIKNVRELHDAIEHLPLSVEILTYQDTAFFFKLRDIVTEISGPWTTKIMTLELWQWLGAGLFIVLSWTFANKARQGMNWIVNYFLHSIHHSSDDVNMLVGLPTLLLLLGLIWGYTLFIFGIPDYLFHQIRVLSEIFICIGLVWFAFSIVSEIARFFLDVSHQTETITDDIIVTLVSSILKIMILVTGAILVAEILSIPYQTVVAGLGIGGVAFAIAARDTVANFFGSAVILTDRPFGPGDVVHIDKYIGSIESVGLRSTRIRDESDSLIFIPNSIVSKDIIINRGRRDRTLVDESLPIDSKTAIEVIDNAAVAIRDFLSKDDIINGKFLVVGINEFEPGTIHLRLRFYINLVDRRLYLEQKHRLLKRVMEILEQYDILLSKPR